MRSSRRISAIDLALLIACLAPGVGCGRAENVPPERLLDADAGGHRLHLMVIGVAKKEQPTVILESGWPGCGIGWNRVRGQVGEFAQVVTYDRAGSGKSDAGPSPRHAYRIAKELHTALENAGIGPPYVLV